MAEGLDAARDLDVIVAIARRQSDPTTFAAWTTAWRIEGQGAGPAKLAVTPPTPQPVATPTPPASPAPPTALTRPELPVPSVGELEKAS